MKAQGGWRPKLRRILALVKKETRQMIRDPATIAVGIVLPVILILLFGFGLSLDVKNVPLAVVLEDSSAPAENLLAAFALSPYFHPQIVYSLQTADRLMMTSSVDGIVTIPPDFGRRFNAGNATVQLVVHGSDANRARIIESYVQGAVGAWSARQSAEDGTTVNGGPVTIQSRLWFNAA